MVEYPGGDRGAKTGFFMRNRNNIQPSCQNTMHAISGCLPAQDVYQWLLSVKVIQRGPDIIKACDTDEGSLLTKENPTSRTCVGACCWKLCGTFAQHWLNLSWPAIGSNLRALSAHDRSQPGLQIVMSWPESSRSIDNNDENHRPW